MVLSLSTQGYQSILLSVSVHLNEPMKQADMLSFFPLPLSLCLFLPPTPVSDLFLFIFSPQIALCLTFLTCPLPRRLFLPPSPLSPHFSVSETSK